ncbi:MAG: YegS/Rv2252/BmrU family lipid kinase [Rikenellaceae bacterium]
MAKKVRFIYNPYSGENKILSSLDFVIHSYQKKGFQIEPFRLANDTTVDNALHGINSEEYHHILISGGDGTVNEIVNGVMRLGIKTPLAILPGGTANDFAHILGYGSSIKKACIEILSGEQTAVDLGVVNGKYFVNVLSAGLFTEISQKTPTKFKNTFGKLAYYVSTVGELPNFRKIHLRIDSKDIVYDDNCLIIFVFNGRTAGNVRIAYQSNLHDGLLDVLVVKGENIVETISTAFHFFTRMSNDYPRGVVHFKTNKLLVRSDDEISVDIDGELGPKLPLEVSCIEQGLNVIVGKAYKFKKSTTH